MVQILFGLCSNTEAILRLLSLVQIQNFGWLLQIHMISCVVWLQPQRYMEESCFSFQEQYLIR